MNIPEQLSAARKTQLEAQLNFFNSFTSKAVANAEKLLALNLDLTRQTVEKSTAAMCQALTAREPADFMALTTRTPETFGSLMAYGRELMSLATGATGTAPAPTVSAAPAAPALEVKPAAKPEAKQRAEQKAEQKAAAPSAEQIIEQAAEQAAEAIVAPLAEPAIPQASAFEAEAAPKVRAKPIAKALGDAMGGAVPKAAAVTVPANAKVKVTSVKPVEATPPAAPAAGTPEVAQHDPAAARGKKKK
ncbi:phasin family protein [Massilia sp. PAMC28688]|uniref:phasin family protein n=1 Tax=Massilia sp. PAMC28688 TaxID=2861283 RepID=UPI001C636467|nr:phasin family protein [Massilia sp. PAMC28688]QYF91839.1 phasin family protein [Massilia sp. PAMC28688]